ncbi:YkvA family protein [Aeromicrobium fastidiosum]|uniref:YkvA family protein n=1 Tax=Aeromicrobium fastidiosum TaxID=52699 RepID=UPI0016600560|nr:YkvA family protein [Aeromicrobium fastidiosum]MBP2392170.1 uncharacterized membrane protein YkvA (DUF1232 family) [Aeromicrobium fastidiosum]
MSPVWQVVVGAIVAVGVLWIVLVVTFYLLGRRHDDPARLRDALRLLPDLVRLLRRLAADRSLPAGVRARVVLLVAYLALPVDLVPDFIPVVGYADDVVVVIWVLRSVTRRAGPDALDRHWPGTPDGLRTLRTLAGLST